MNNELDSIFNEAALLSNEDVEVRKVVRKSDDYIYHMQLDGFGYVPKKYVEEKDTENYRSHLFLRKVVNTVCRFFLDDCLIIENRFGFQACIENRRYPFMVTYNVFFDKRFISVRRLICFLTCFKFYLTGEYDGLEIRRIILSRNTGAETKDPLTEEYVVEGRFITNLHNFRRFDMVPEQLSFGEFCSFLEHFTENDVDWYKGLCEVIGYDPDFSEMIVKSSYSYNRRKEIEDITGTVHPFIREVLDKGFSIKMLENELDERLNYVFISFLYLDEVETLRSENGELRNRKVEYSDNGRPVKSWKVIRNDAGVRLYGYLGTKRKGENVAAECLVISPEAGYSLKYEEYLDYDEKCYTTENLIPLGLWKFTDAAITKKMINFGLFDRHIEKKEEYNEKITVINEEINNILKYI